MGLFKTKREKELETEVSDLWKERGDLKKEVEYLKLQKKIETEDIKHMVKIKEEKMVVENERKQLERDREKDGEIAKVKDSYHDKVEKNLEKQLDNMKSMYGEILDRLPNVNVKLRGDV